VVRRSKRFFFGRHAEVRRRVERLRGASKAGFSCVEASLAGVEAGEAAERAHLGAESRARGPASSSSDGGGGQGARSKTLDGLEGWVLKVRVPRGAVIWSAKAAGKVHGSEVSERGWLKTLEAD
jgi:hypothetical protein